MGEDFFLNFDMQAQWSKPKCQITQFRVCSLFFLLQVLFKYVYVSVCKHNPAQCFSTLPTFKMSELQLSLQHTSLQLKIQWFHLCSMQSLIYHISLCYVLACYILGNSACCLVDCSEYLNNWKNWLIPQADAHR